MRNFNSFEYGEWSIKVKNKKLYIVVVYVPPYSAHNRTSINTSKKEWEELIEERSLLSDKVVITGDINIHCEILNDPSSVYFNEIMDCYRFQNKVNFPTHEAGRSLEIFMSRDGDVLFLIVV